ncbi:UPF0125 protein RatB [hydrothermal vent metagenome]|uniref:UPF0125 protein RatB n=1 Tax=hydrothermal vent metagenome TaxID=652676 RepID=A0A3B0XNX7_9ZZZZ
MSDSESQPVNTENTHTESLDVQPLQVEVACATPEKQLILPLTVDPGTTLEQAVELSGIINHFHEIDLSKNKVGIFGKLSKKTTELKDGDRVEIYRPLIADPKEVRRKREAEGKRMSKGGGEKESA